MDARPVCCEPCHDLEFCSPRSNCCLECHFSYEEELAAPYLPPHLRRQLHAQHQYLIAIGMPDDEVRKHAEWEEPIFRKYCPPEVCEQIESDHRKHGQGKLYKRDEVIATLREFLR